MAGAIAKLLMPGRDPGGCIITILLGIAGALLAGFLGQAIGWYERGEGAGFIAAIVGAFLILLIYRLICAAAKSLARTSSVQRCSHGAHATLRSCCSRIRGVTDERACCSPLACGAGRSRGGAGADGAVDVSRSPGTRLDVSATGEVSRVPDIGDHFRRAW